MLSQFKLVPADQKTYKMFKLILIATFVAAALAVEVPVTPCAGHPEATSFSIPECSALPCEISVGQTITLDIQFATNSLTTSMPVFAMVTSGGREFPFELPTGDACAAANPACPAPAGNMNVRFPVTISGVNAGDETSVRVQFNNQAGAVLACGTVSTTFV